MMHTPRVLVTILNWNKLDDTFQCIDSVLNSNYSEFDIYVIDNGSTTDPSDLIREKYPDVLYTRKLMNTGFTGGNNIGMQFALDHNYEYIWLLNNDTIVDTECLTNLVAASQEDPRVGLASPLILNRLDRDQILFCGASVELDNAIIHIAKSIEEFRSWQEARPESIILWGTALLIKVELIRKIGLLDEIFFAYAEDVDYSIRSAKADYRNIMILSTVIYHHKRPENPVDLPDYYHFYATRNIYYLWNKHLPKRKAYFRKFLGIYLLRAISFHEYNANCVANAIIDAIWCVIIGRKGCWDERQTTPIGLQNSIANHLWLWSKLGKFLKI